MAEPSEVTDSAYPEWIFSGEAANHHYLVPGVLKALGPGSGRKVLDIGCGNGALTAKLAGSGTDATGIDFSESGIERARQSYPHVSFRAHQIDEPLPDELRGCFDVVVSAEVIEHLFLPRKLFQRASEALVDSGLFIVTTPYHGYVKNLALALTGRFDQHWQTTSDYGHIKHFSQATLGQLAQDCGFEPVAWRRAGRVKPVAATMILTSRMVPSKAPATR